jgi:sarcosine oxidase subunit gamma
VSEPLAAQSAFHGHLAYSGMEMDQANAGVIVRSRDDLALAIVMTRKHHGVELRSRIQALFGIALPTGPKRIAAGPIAMIGMGRGQWLAVEEGGDALTFAGRLAGGVGDAASISDQSDSRAILEMSGPKVRDVLAKGLAIDLHPRAFGPGDAALSSIALIGAHLWQVDAVPTYQVAVFRSMAGSFAEFVWAGAAEYGIASTA